MVTRSTADPGAAFWLSLILAGVSLIVSAYAGYNHNDKAMEHRVTTIEVQQKNDASTIQRVESKVDKLVEWALGKP